MPISASPSSTQLRLSTRPGSPETPCDPVMKSTSHKLAHSRQRFITRRSLHSHRGNKTNQSKAQPRPEMTRERALASMGIDQMEPVAPGSSGDHPGRRREERKQQRKSKQLALMPCSWIPSTLPTGLAKVERETQAPAKYGAQPGAALLLLVLRRC